ncbi:glycosyltransferase [Gluconacetobacter takamatsuzukensis]|uniref:Glycosyltransferase n=1 Tax=Gluconacetobacter takamatsuzukensis TaxID=1286190 RepID=A0A7W4KF51_9PROT|nr:glycosyltransferase [Gluconacetobacter takamatsuzukensis]MBB2205754.1 glycosyltransferase [Gluconacetobacter takamatsuzukensis]
MDADDWHPLLHPLPGGPELLGCDALDPYFVAPPDLDPDPAITMVLPFLGWIVTLARPHHVGLFPDRPAMRAFLHDQAHRLRLPLTIHTTPTRMLRGTCDLLWLALPPTGTGDHTPAHLVPLLSPHGAILLYGLDHTADQHDAWSRWLAEVPAATLPLGRGLTLALPAPTPATGRANPLAALCSALGPSGGDSVAANLANRFAAIGTHWATRRTLADTRAELAQTRAALSRARLDTMELRLERNQRAAPAATPPTNPATTPAAPAPTPTPTLRARLARLLVRRHTLQAEPPPPAPPRARLPIRTVLFISGEPATPGTVYRVDRNAAACRQAGYDTRSRDCAAITPDDMLWADLVVLWRVEYSGHVDTLIRMARARGALLAFDADDLVFEPELARTDLIDGIRSSPAPVARIERMYDDMQRTLQRCDLGIATTQALGDRMRPFTPLTAILPNIHDQSTLKRSRHAARRRAATPPDGLVRIGYATGSRTHQRDFARVLPGLLAVMAQRPEVRLVLFREPGGGRPLLLTEEFPTLHANAARIEWRDMVNLDALPDELARLDIAIAPLETGNPFCEAKSELKFFEAALAGVCTVASPTAPFRAAIRDGVTGLLADSDAEWAEALLRLVDDPPLRARMARDALHTVLWEYGPQRQAALMELTIKGLAGGPITAQAGALALAQGSARVRAVPTIHDSETLLHQDQLQDAAVSIVITAWQYADHIIEALDSVRRQTLAPLDLIVVDDASTDDTVALVSGWMARHGDRFNRLLLLRACCNAGLGGARNIGMAAAETRYVMQLDADNRLLPDACARLLDAIQRDDAGFAYPIIRRFGRADGVMGDLPWHPGRLVGGNVVDAMAMVAKWAWAAAGGYYVRRDAMGWEDYDLWCTLAELGIAGTHVPEILAEYRVHNAAMTDSVTERTTHKQRVVAWLRARHPWIRLTAPDARNRA